MRLKTLIFFIIFTLLEGFSYGLENSPYVEGELLVKYKKGLSKKSRDMIAQQLSTNRVKELTAFDIDLIELPYGMSVEEGIRKYRFYPKVEIAEPNYYIYAFSKTPDDTNFSILWGLNNTGQTVNGTSGTSDADIDAPEAWDTTTGSSSIIVAVLDTGLDLDHEDLSGNIWSNSEEISGNGIDDDGNGYKDDVKGWDFVNSDNNPDDDNGHGSFVGGIIAGTGNNSKGICGVNWTAKIMALKILDSSGSGDTASAISAIQYATTKGAKVINASWGGTSSSDSLKSAIESSNILFVTASGNNGDGNASQGWDVDTSGNEIYPACYTSTNILSIAATDQSDNLCDFSNYGATSIDVAAPGKNIYSTYYSNTYAYADGTSASCAYVSGLAGLLLAVKSTLTATELKDQIINSIDQKSSLIGKTFSGGRINAYNAVNLPSAPSSFSATSASSNQINLSWTDNSLNELGFKIERKSGSATYTQIAIASRNATSYSDTGLSAGTTYTYRIRAYNNIGDSSYSSEASATTSSGSSSGGGGGGGGGCFIATAAFGSPLEKEVKILCRYRDIYLVNSFLGREFLGFYNYVSPYIARVIEHNNYLKGIVRFILRIIILVIKIFTSGA